MTQQPVLTTQQVTKADRINLIRMVRERPMIWDSTATKDKGQLQTDWYNISQSLSSLGRNFDVALVKKIWTYLRSQYMKIMKAGKAETSTWQYLDELSFLGGSGNESSGASGGTRTVKVEAAQHPMMDQFMQQEQMDGPMPFIPPSELTEDAMLVYLQQMRNLGFLSPQQVFMSPMNAEMQPDKAFQQPSQFAHHFALDPQMPQSAEMQPTYQQMPTMQQDHSFQQPSQFAHQFDLNQQMPSVPQICEKANGGYTGDASLKTESRKRSQTHLADDHETSLNPPDSKRFAIEPAQSSHGALISLAQERESLRLVVADLIKHVGQFLRNLSEVEQQVY